MYFYLFSSENNRVFVKLTHSKIYKNIPNNKKVFFFDENRETLFLKQKPFNQYKYDYIFSESENPMIISSTLNAFIYPLIEQEKNLLFLCIGKRNLISSNFIFGNNQNNILGSDSFFNHSFKAIKQIMKRISYDKILLELYKIVNDKFVVDFKEIINNIDNISYDIINQHIKKSEFKDKEKSRSTNANNINYNTEINEGHIILKIKFFKFLTNNDLSKSQRQIEVIRTFSYIDIKDDEEDAYVSKSASNNKSQSIYFFKKMIQSITNYDLDKFTEISSNLTDILRDMFSVPNLYSFIFGLVNEYRDDIDQALRTLNLLNICKNIDNDKFYMKLYQMNLSISRLENKALKQDFQILNLIFGEIIYFLEKTFQKLDDFYTESKDIELKEKFFYLKQWLIKNRYDFQKNQTFCIILENTLGYINNRAQWMQLMKAKNMVMKLTEGLKMVDSNNSINRNNITTKYKMIKNNNNEFYSINSKTFNKMELNNITNNNNSNLMYKNKISSIDSDQKIFQDLDNEIKTQKIKPKNKPKEIPNNNNYIKIELKKENKSKNINPKKDKSSTFGLSDFSCFDSKKQKKLDILNNMNSRSIGEFPTGAKSIEASFTQKLFKGLQGNFRHLFSDIYFRFTKEEESGCIVCRNDIPNTKNYKLNCDKWVNEYKSLSQLETGINMDKISMIYTGSNKNKNNNTSSFYDKDEEIKIHFLDDDKSIKYMKNKNNINNSRNNNNYMKNYNTISYNDNSKRNK
jgi:hypothetical protein